MDAPPPPAVQAVEDLNGRGVDSLARLDFAEAKDCFYAAVAEINQQQRAIEEQQDSAAQEIADLRVGLDVSRPIQEQWQEIRAPQDAEQEAGMQAEDADQSAFRVYDKAFLLTLHRLEQGQDEIAAVGERGGTGEVDNAEGAVGEVAAEELDEVVAVAEELNHEAVEAAIEAGEGDEVQEGAGGEEEGEAIVAPSEAAMTRMAAAVLYNAGVTHHMRGLYELPTQALDFRRSLQFYRIGSRLLNLEDADAADQTAALGNRLLLLAFYNNMAHIHMHLVENAAFNRCLGAVQQVLGVGPASPEDTHFALNILTSQNNNRRAAAMA